MLHIGQQFLSYESVERAVEDFENKHHVKFMKLRTFSFGISDAPYNVNLRFKLMQFRCVRGGPSKKKGIGLRKTSTIKQDCPAGIEFRASSDKMRLEVRKMTTKHNHELSQRWVYFKNGISRRLKEKLNLQKVFIRRNLYQLDGNENLVAALVEPRLLATLQSRIAKKNKRKSFPDQEVLRATESLQFEEPNVDNTIPESPIENQSSENLSAGITRDLEKNSNDISISNSVMKTQKLILKTLNELNQAMQSLASNMTVMANTISNLNTSLSSITHIILPEEQILGS